MYRVYVRTHDAAATNPATGGAVLSAQKSTACVLETRDRKKALQRAAAVYREEENFLNGTGGMDISVTVQWTAN